MHAVKGNLANTVCKRKHQHIASVPVLDGPCMLFSNFYSFLWGRGVWGGGFLLPLPSVTLTQSQGEAASVTGKYALWPTQSSQTMCQTMGPCSRTNLHTHLQLYTDIQHGTQTHSVRPTNISVDLIILHLSAGAHLHTLCTGIWGRQGRLEANLVSKHPFFMCRQCAWAAPPNAAVTAAEGPMFATHVNIWQSITFPPHNILLLRPLKWGR